MFCQRCGKKQKELRSVMMFLDDNCYQQLMKWFEEKGREASFVEVEVEYKK